MIPFTDPSYVAKQCCLGSDRSVPPSLTNSPFFFRVKKFFGTKIPGKTERLGNPRIFFWKHVETSTWTSQLLGALPKKQKQEVKVNSSTNKNRALGHFLCEQMAGNDFVLPKCSRILSLCGDGHITHGTDRRKSFSAEAKAREITRTSWFLSIFVESVFVELHKTFQKPTLKGGVTNRCRVRCINFSTCQVFKEFSLTKKQICQTKKSGKKLLLLGLFFLLISLPQLLWFSTKFFWRSSPAHVFWEKKSL